MYNVNLLFLQVHMKQASELNHTETLISKLATVYLCEFHMGISNGMEKAAQSRVSDTVLKKTSIYSLNGRELL